MDTLRSNKMMFENNHAYQRGQEDQNKILADHFIYFLNIDVLTWFWPIGDALSAMGIAIVGGHRHQGIAITMLLIRHVERAIVLREMPALLLRVRIT